jgi:tetratricopeptide (TPR) repeat protein
MATAGYSGTNHCYGSASVSLDGHCYLINGIVFWSPPFEILKMLVPHNHLKFSLLALSVFLLSGCTQASAPPELVEQAGQSYLKCYDDLHKHDLNGADTECQAGLKTLNGYDHRVKVGLFNGLSSVEGLRHHDEKASEYAEQAVNLAAKVDGKKSPYYAVALTRLAVTKEALLQFKLAEPMALESERVLALSLKQPQFQNFLQEEGHTKQVLVMALIGQGKEKEAIALIPALLEAKGKASPSQFDVMMAYGSISSELGEFYYERGLTEKAQSAFEKSVSLYEKYKTLSPESSQHLGTTIVMPYPSTIKAMNRLADIYEKQGKATQAKTMRNNANTLDSTTQMMKRLH